MDLKSTPRTLRAQLERRFVTIEEVFAIGGREITILRPRSAEDLISEEDFERDERLPYWADVWPSSRVLASYLLEKWRPADATIPHALELGCGVGLVACAALLRDLQVTATDYYRDALAFTLVNAHLNGLPEPHVRELDWRSLKTDPATYDVILASDVLYETTYPAVVAKVLASYLAPGGVAILADPGRLGATSFLENAVSEGLQLRGEECRAFHEGSVRQTVTIYTFARSPSSSAALTSTPQR